MTALSATRGANFWSRRPVTRMDLVVGAYEDIASDEVPGFTDRLLAALPGLVEHRCSIGERGGFVTRLRRGTYAPHIVEHVALELQTIMGHDVGFGRTRGGDADDEYTLVFEHLHEAVGLRAAAHALAVVQETFAGAVPAVDHLAAELTAIAAEPDVPAPTAHVRCAITGGGARAAARDEVARRAGADDAGRLVVDVSPGFILQAGLPYGRSDVAVVLDTDVTDVPERYRDVERARRLVSVVADGVRRGGLVIAPAKEWEVQDYARDAHCRVAVFSTRDDVTPRDRKVARAAAWVADGHVVVEELGTRTDAGPLLPEVPAAAQVAATLAEFALRRGDGRG
jgi:cyanophycin synthetase